MEIVHWLWRELTRPRGPTRHAFYRARRRSKSGIALLITFTSLMFLIMLAADLSFEATVRLQLGAHERDEAKAEALAETGVRIYQLILVASKAIGKNPMIQQVEAMMGLDLGDSLWQMVPFINTGMMRMVFVTDGSADEIEDIGGGDGTSLSGGLSDEQIAESRESGAFTHNFLDFEGDFYAEVSDEDRKVNIANFRATNRVDLETDPTAVMLYGMMTGMRTCPNPYASADQADLSQQEQEDLDRFFLDENIDRWELIGNLVDWTDLDNQRIFDGGNEDSVYANLDKDPYLPKNAGFETLDEVRLVDLWNKDAVWDRFGTNVTVYGTGKVNVNTAECDVLWALVKSYVQPPPNDYEVARLLQAIQDYRNLGVSFQSGTQFANLLTQQGVQVDAKLKSAATTESQVFRVVSTGEVGGSTVTIEAVIDFSDRVTTQIGTAAGSSRVGRIVYWRKR